MGVQLPMLPIVAASKIKDCRRLLKNYPFNRAVFEDLSCYIVNPEYLAWTIKLRPPIEGETVEGNGTSGFVPPTQLVYADVLRNYMEKIVPLNFAVGDITIELRYTADREMRLWCVDFVMEPVVRNDIPMPPVLPHIQSKLPNHFKAFPFTSSNQIYPHPSQMSRQPVPSVNNKNEVTVTTISVPKPIPRKRKRKQLRNP